MSKLVTYESGQRLSAADVSFLYKATHIVMLENNY